MDQPPEDNSGGVPSVQRSLKAELDGLQKKQTFRIWLCSHRGNTRQGIKNGVPENSLKAINTAIEAGADMVEIDIRSTSDGILVLMHDKTIDRTTNGNGSLSSIDFAQLKRYKLKDSQGKITGESVPILEEALKLGQGKIFFNLDIANKDIPVHKIVALIQKLKMEDEVLLYTSTDRNLASDLQATERRLLLHPMVKSSDDILFFSSKLVSVQVFQLSISDAFSGTLPKEIEGSSRLCFSNIVGKYDTNMAAGDYSGLVNMINKRIGIIQTDYTELADTYLKLKGYR